MREGIVLTPAFELEVDLGESMDLGVTRSGHRRVTPIIGGELRSIGSGPEGEVLRARVLAGGADRQLVRPDGAIEIDARYTAETNEGAVLDIHAVGLRRPVRDGVYFRVSVRFECDRFSSAGLQDSLFIADGVREQTRVRHLVYRVG